MNPTPAQGLGDEGVGVLPLGMVPDFPVDILHRTEPDNRVARVGLARGHDLRPGIGRHGRSALAIQAYDAVLSMSLRHVRGN